MPRTSSSSSSSSPAATKTGEELTRSVAGNVIEQHSLAPHPPEQSAEHDEERNRRIAIAAYYRAERRGFAPGGELEDWLEAEREVSESAGAGGIG